MTIEYHKQLDKIGTRHLFVKILNNYVKRIL